MNDRLSPERALRFYIRIAQVAVENGALGLALAAIANVRDSIAQLQEHA